MTSVLSLTNPFAIRSLPAMDGSMNVKQFQNGFWSMERALLHGSHYSCASLFLLKIRRNELPETSTQQYHFSLGITMLLCRLFADPHLLYHNRPRVTLLFTLDNPPIPSHQFPLEPMMLLSTPTIAVENNTVA